MAALAAARNTVEYHPSPFKMPHEFPAAAAKKLYKGAIACLDASGNVTPGATATGLKALGRVAFEADNSAGGAGAIRCKVDGGVFRYANSAAADAIASADKGNLCYIVDDQTVAKTDGGSTRSTAGRIYAVDSDGVWVAFVYPLAP